MDLTRQGGVSDYLVEGRVNTLICRAYMFSTPPEWFYLNGATGELVKIRESRPPQGKS